MDKTRTTLLVRDLAAGDKRAVDELIELVRTRLHALAQRLMSREHPNHTLQPTALVNEVYLDLVDQTKVDWTGKTHFYAVAA